MKRVLIVDDAAFMRLVIRKLLEENGFEVVGEAENGEVGVQKYMEYNPDLVTMDIIMPQMTGIEALKVIREYDPKAKIVMVTAIGHETTVKDAVRYGAKSFIVKPYKEELLLDTLNKVEAMD